MVKCKDCNLCLRLDRIDLVEKSLILWYCDLCGNVYRIVMGKLEEVKEDTGYPNMLRERHNLPLRDNNE